MASKLSAAVRALLNAAGDAGTELQKIMWGTAASPKVFYPSIPGLDQIGSPQSRGQALTTGVSFDFLITRGLAPFFDEQSISWAAIQTNATGAVPTYAISHGFDVATPIVKDEVANTLACAFDEDYALPLYVTLGCMTLSKAVLYVHAQSTHTVKFEYSAVPTGAPIAINNQWAYVFVIGQR